MPATYAAVSACLNALTEARPDFAPKTLLDVGAGPGTASWAAAETFTSLQDFMLLDINAALQKLALDLGNAHPRLTAMTCRRDADALDEVGPADFVIASYLIGEVSDAERRRLAERLWMKTRDTLRRGRARHASRLCADRRASRADDRKRRPCRRPLPARSGVSACRAGLVPLRATPATAARPYSGQGCGASVRGREVQLRRADTRTAGAAASRGCWRRPPSARSR